MSKTLKRYDKVQGKWVSVSKQNIEVHNDLGENGKISDINVNVTNPNYSDDGDLNEALSDINDNIDTLQRNVSWLAEHGGGGSGNGYFPEAPFDGKTYGRKDGEWAEVTGGTGSVGGEYKFDVISPVIRDGAVYTSEKKILVTFRIIGGASYDICKYRYSYDGGTFTDYQDIKNGTEVTISFDNTNSNRPYHTLRLDGMTPYGITIEPVQFYIYQNSIEIELNKDKNKLLAGNIVLVSQNDVDGYVYVDMTNLMLNSDTYLIATYGGTVTKQYRYYNEVTDKYAITFKLWDMIKRENVNVGNEYVVSVKAVANDNPSNELQIRIQITNPNDLSVYVGGVSNINIQDDDEDIMKGRQDSNLVYYFKVSIPDRFLNKRAYVAGKITNKTKGTEELIFGKYYDETLREEGAMFRDNGYVLNNADSQNNFYLDGSMYSVNDICVISVVAYYDAEIFAVGEGKFKVEANSSDIYPRQFRPRNLNEDPNTLLFSWNAKNISALYNNKWVSNVRNYKPLNGGNEDISLSLNVFDSNGVNNGILTTVDVPYLKLSNFAYAVCDMQSNMTANNEMIYLFANSGNSFTISMCFEIPETNDSNGTVFQYGEISEGGDLVNGILITLDNVIWKIQETTLIAPIAQGIKNTVDFVYDEAADNARIYVNGVTNQSGSLNRKLTQENYNTFLFPDRMYFGCGYNNTNLYYNHTDVNIYEFSIYTKRLTDIDITINSKNARLEGKETNPSVIADYEDWKKDNYIYSHVVTVDGEITGYVPRSYLTDANGMFKKSFNDQEFATITNAARTPVILINFDDTVDFTEDYFTEPHNKSEVKKYDAKITYYDGGKTVTFKAKVELQGSSTLGYRIKNLEVIVDEVTQHDSSKTKLFQPIKTWFPEKEFTLKADIVDSSHANNATLGKWINESGMFSNIPPMDVLEETKNDADGNLVKPNRPKDKAYFNKSQDKDRVEIDSKIYEHIGNGQYNIDYDEDVTIKHNLEGFPVLVFIHFSKSDVYAKLIGIYSFNLGRNSYYNLGLKFLESFSRRSFDNPDIVESCPALIESYDEIVNGYFGNSANKIDVNSVYVYELGDNGNENDTEFYTFSQDDISWIEYLGEFKYESGEEGIVSIQPLFKTLAQIDASTVYKDTNAAPFFTPREKYTVDAKNNKVKVGGNYKGNEDNALSNLTNVLHIDNAIAYYVICNAFGMIDSPGKNLQLRTWDKKKWYTGFYDMDSALGLYNTGAEGVPTDASIDGIRNEKNGENGTTQVYFDYSQNEDSFNGFRSKLWASLRSGGVDGVTGGFFYNYKGTHTYDDVWYINRQKNGPLETYTSFTDMMAEQIGKCSDLVYNYDYNSKYIEYGTNLSMLHGTRIEYVKRWLKNRFYFLDGYFMNQSEGVDSGVFTDSPYYNDKLDISNGGKEGETRFVIETKISTFAGFKTANDATEYFFYLPANTPTEFVAQPGVTAGRQWYFRSSSLFTQLKGLNEIKFNNITQNAIKGSLRSLLEFDISNVKTLSDDAVNFIVNDKTCVFTDENGHSSLRTLKLNNTGGASTFKVNLTGYEKLQYVDISSSCVDSLVLPDTSLKTLLIANSNIITFEVKNQTILSELDFTGCNKLTKVNIENCSQLTTLRFDSLEMLSDITVRNCKNLKNIIINNNKVLAKISIIDNSNLEEVRVTKNNVISNIDITRCSNIKVLEVSESYNDDETTGLSLNIDDASFEELYLNKIYSLKPFKFPAAEKFSNLKVMDIDTVSTLDSIFYNNVESDTFDLSYVENISKRDFEFNNLPSLKNVRLMNDAENPVELPTFYDCTNIERIYGNILVTNGTRFNFSQFRINDSYGKEINGISDFGDGFFLDGDTVTNLTFDVDTTDINYIMSSTNIGLEDVYYVLSKCDNIKNMSHAFYNCSNIVCATSEHVEYVSYDNDRVVFYKPKGNTIDDEGVKRLDTDMFAKCGNVEIIDSLFEKCLFLWSYLDNEAFAPLQKVTEFNNVFKGCMIAIPSDRPILGDISGNIKKLTGIEFWPFRGGESYQYFDQEILNGFNNLEVIEDSFNYKSIIFNEGDNGEMFTNLSNLREIKSSFKHLETVLRGGGNQFMNIDGTLFKGCTSLTTIEDSFTIDNGGNILFGLNITGDMFKDCPNFTGILVGNKDYADQCFKGFVKVYNYKTGFPTNVFKGLPNITNLEGFFNGLMPYDFENDTPVANTDEVLKLPGDMFVNNTKLESVKGLFEDIKGISYELTSCGFENCSLTDVSNVFAGGKKIGMIPYKLFYQKKGNIITNMSNALGNSASGDMLLSAFEFDMNDERLRDELFVSGTSYGYSESGVNHYTTDVEETVGKDNVKTFDYQWNLLTYDGSSDFISRFEESAKALFNADTYPVNYYPELFSDYKQLDPVPQAFDSYTSFGVNETMARTLSVTNYICPADLFAYCANDKGTDVTNALANSGKINTNKQVITGYCGRIPNLLFRPIDRVTNLSGIFGGVNTVMPHRWCEVNGANDGVMYPSDLFSGSSATNISSIFSGNEIWGGTVVSKELFNNLSATLTNVSGLWSSTVWHGGYQLGDYDQFSGCTNIYDVSSMFSSGEGVEMQSNLFNASVHTSIANCSNFMNRLRNIEPNKINFIEFWNFKAYKNGIMVYKGCYGFEGVAKTNPSVGGIWVEWIEMN